MELLKPSDVLFHSESASVKKQRRWPLVVGMFAGMLAWLIFVFAGTLYGWWRQPLAPQGDARAFASAAVRKLEQNRRGNAVFVLIQTGSPVSEHAASIGPPVDGDTLFQVALVKQVGLGMGCDDTGAGRQA